MMDNVCSYRNYFTLHFFHQDGPSPQRYRGDGYCVCMTLDSGFRSEIGELEIV